jgi:hypothetical protein
VQITPAGENNLSTSQEVPLIANTLRAILLRMGKYVEFSFQNLSALLELTGTTRAKKMYFLISS